MILALLILGLVLLAVPGVLSEPPRRLPAREWTPVALLALVVGVLALLSGLTLAELPTVAPVFGISAFADRCRELLAPFAIESGVFDVLAAGLAILIASRITFRVVHSARAARHARIEPWLGEHEPRAGFNLVTVPTDRILAFGVPGRTPQVVLSTGLIERLGPDGLEAVIGHEAAHLRLHHPAMVAVLHGVDAGVGALPFAARSVQRLRTGLEVWADAAVDRDATGRRREALCAALACVTAPAITMGARSDAEHRIGRLRWALRPRPVYARSAVYASVLILSVVLAVTAVGWFTDAHHAVALGAPCVH